MDDFTGLPEKLLEKRGQWSEIARKAGVNFYTVQRIARGKTPNPGVETMRKIARALNQPA